MKNLYLLPILFFCLSLQAQDNNNCHLKVGTNLAGPVDWGSEYPFVDIMKYSRTWITFNHIWVAGGQNDWDTGVLDQIPQDEQGYPLELPYEVPGTETLQAVRTVWANTAELPGGTYVALYDGEGVIDFWGDATITSQEAGRIEFTVTPGVDNIMTLEILESQAGNHIHNIRILLPGTESTYESNPWTQEWIDKLEPFQALRFMDWGLTNNSEMRHWSDRTQPDFYTYTSRSGVPYEWWIELCNQKKADAWICVPHLASEDYITQMATLFRDNLDEDLKIHVEYSNEIWNWLFAQTQYCHDSLNQNLLWPERLGPKIADVLQIWTDVFDGQSDRLVRVLACQNGWFDICDRIYAQIEAEGQDNLIDAISPSAYFSYDPDVIAPLGNTATGVDVINSAREFSFDPANYLMTSWNQHASLASDNNKQLLFYEAGQHFTPEPWGTIQPYNLALLEAQVIPEMYDLYNEWMDTIAQLSNQEMLLMHFSFIAPIDLEDPAAARWGSFGALTSQFYAFPPYDDAPKYRSLVEHIDTCALVISTEQPLEEMELSIFPNPASRLTYLSLRTQKAEDLKIMISNTQGQLMRSLREKAQPNGDRIPIDLSGLTNGVYFVEVRLKNINRVLKILVL